MHRIGAESPQSSPTMKNLISLCVLAFAISLAPLTFTGCKTTPQSAKAVTYKTLKSTQIAVDSAMKVYGTACAKGKVSLEKQARVDGAKAQFESAFATAVMAARGNLNGAPPVDVQMLAEQLQLLITNL